MRAISAFGWFVFFAFAVFVAAFFAGWALVIGDDICLILAMAVMLGLIIGGLRTVKWWW